MAVLDIGVVEHFARAHIGHKHFSKIGKLLSSGIVDVCSASSLCGDVGTSLNDKIRFSAADQK